MTTKKKPRLHAKILHGKCGECGHYGEDCTGIDERETAAILAGLRLFQQAGDSGLDMDIWDIATNGGETERLGDDEIGALCEKLNLSEG